MHRDAMEVIRGSADVFRDLSETDADGKQLKALRAAEIIQVLDRYRLTVRAVRQRTDVPAADFFRIRNANLERFALDRLLGIINRPGSDVKVKLKVRPGVRTAHPAAA